MRTIVITGANSGLGFEVAKKVAAQQDTCVYLACRNADKAEQARAAIVAETGNDNVRIVVLDTSSLASVRGCAAALAEDGVSIDVLLNNAGISAMGHDGTTADGFEVVFATNYLGHYLLTRLLLSQMAKGARIINVTSDMHNPPQGITWPGAEQVAHPTKNDRSKYSYSKLAAIYFTHELARRLEAASSTVTASSFNPGFMADTGFSGAGKAQALMVKAAMPERYSTLAASSEALAHLVLDPALCQGTGEYYDRSVNVVPSSKLSYDETNARELWNASAAWVGLPQEIC